MSNLCYYFDYDSKLNQSRIIDNYSQNFLFPLQWLSSKCFKKHHDPLINFNESDLFKGVTIKVKLLTNIFNFLNYLVTEMPYYSYEVFITKYFDKDKEYQLFYNLLLNTVDEFEGQTDNSCVTFIIK